MDALVSLSSGASTSSYATKVENVQLRSQEFCMASLNCLNSPVHGQTRVKCVSRCQSLRTNFVVNVVAGAKKERKAKLSAESERTMPLPIFTDKHGMPQPLSQFLQQPAGMKSMLNTSYLEDFEYLGGNVFRCYLPKISVLNREVAPVMDLLVYATESECVVEMIACKFESPDASVEKAQRFSANLKNHLQWKYGENGELLLRTNLNINVLIEVHTLPFTMLPLSAVETPGNAVLQAMVDRMVPAFMEHLLKDYYEWVEEKTAVSDIVISPVVPDSDLKVMPDVSL